MRRVDELVFIVMLCYVKYMNMKNMNAVSSWMEADSRISTFALLFVKRLVVCNVYRWVAFDIRL